MAKLTHKIGEMLVECEIDHIPAQSKAEAIIKAYRMFKAKIAPGDPELPHLVSVEEERAVGANSQIIIA